MITQELVSKPDQTTRYKVTMLGPKVVAEPLIDREWLSSISMGWFAPYEDESLEFCVVLRPTDTLSVRYEGVATIVVEDLTRNNL